MPKGAGAVRPVEGGKWRTATRRADAGRLRGGARAGNKQCRVRRSIRPTHSERALLNCSAAPGVQPPKSRRLVLLTNQSTTPPHLKRYDAGVDVRLHDARGIVRFAPKA